jgi:hypothetical protein
MQRPKIGFLQRAFERTSLDTALEPELNCLINAAPRVVGVGALRCDANRGAYRNPALFRVAPDECAQVGRRG